MTSTHSRTQNCFTKKHHMVTEKPTNPVLRRGRYSLCQSTVTSGQSLLRLLPCSAFPLRCTMWQRRTFSVRTHGQHSERKVPKAPTTARAVSTDRCIDKSDRGSSHFHGVPDRKKCLRHHRAIHDLRLGKFRSVFFQPPFFVPSVRRKCTKSIIC